MTIDVHSDVLMTARSVRGEYDLDLITAEAIRAGLIEVTRHMRDSLVRSAYSNTIRDILDFGVAIHHVGAEGSEMSAITEGCCHFAFTHQHMTNMVMDEWGYDNLGPGDTIFCNDSWRGAIHFPDVNLFRPIFWKDEPIFVLTDATHIMDIGGPVPGGFNAAATTHFEEGLRFPPILITSAGKPVRSTINLILENTRTPFENLGDIRALFGTLKIGEDRLLGLVRRYGIEAVRAGARYTLDLAERRMRRAIEQIPDGVWEGEDFIDDDAVDFDEPLKLAATVRKEGDSIEIDFSGSSRQPLGALMTCWEDVNRCLVGPKVMLDPRHPMNAGAMRPFHVLAPAGSVMMGLPPASQSMHTDVAMHAANLTMDIFGRMGAARKIASDSASTHVHVIAGVDTRPGREGSPWAAALGLGGSWGGTDSNDGISFNPSSIFNITDNNIEMLERDNPMMIRGRNLLMDAAAAGQFRSGFANTLIMEVTSDMTQATILLDAGRFPRPGLASGGSGMTSYLYRVKPQPGNVIRQRNGIIPLSDLEPLAGKVDADGAPDSGGGQWCVDTELRTLKLTGLPLRKGDILYLVCATGGGYGDPLERDPERVRADVWNERISPEFARDAYGVVITDGEVDARATTELRAGYRAGGWTVPVAGPRRWPRTWEEMT
ncbi:hydantoinase B/oxoprolinase family protein [Nocardia nova]|uniref:hydantoinase B/oxoprolinase family protein n=1 Tax=Nocardia nova TaxID=37330 RepID=UPI003407283A